MKPLLMVVLLVSIAHADTRVSVRAPHANAEEQPVLVRLPWLPPHARIDELSLDVRSAVASVRATLRLRVSTRRREPVDLRVPIEVATGTKVTGMTYALGDEPSIMAGLHDAHVVRAVYEQVVERRLDPALLRLVDTFDTHDALELAVFPVTRGVPATVTIEMTLPRATRLVLDPGETKLARVQVTIEDVAHAWRQVAAPRSFALPAPRLPASWMTEDPREELHVDVARALFAGDAPTPAATIERRRQQLPVVVVSDRRYELRTLVRAHAAQLEHCYAFGVAAKPRLAATAELALEIDAGGTIREVEVTGELDDASVRRCIADEIADWRFAPGGHQRRVRQAIDLRDLR